MAKLIYSAVVSLDGYIADRHGNFDWAAPDEEVHTFVNELQWPMGTYLYGRRMYEFMAIWQTLQTEGQPPFIADFANIWRSADKVVYSTTLVLASTPRTRVERALDPEAVRSMKASEARDMTVSGPALASQAFKAGLVDDCQLFVVPIIVGGGKPAYSSGVRLELTLEDRQRFGNGMVYLHNRSATGCAAP